MLRQRGRGHQRAAPALAVELEHQVGLGRHLEQAQRHLVHAAGGAARERLVPEHLAAAQLDDRLEHGAELVGEQHLLQLAAVLQLALRAQHVHAAPRLLDQPRDEPLRHHQRVVEREREAHRDAAQVAEVRAREPGQLAVDVALDALGGRLQVGDAQRPLAPLGREEDEERVAAAVVQADDVVVADLVALELEHQVARHGHHLGERGRAVLVLDLRERGGVDQQQPEAALLHEHAPQVLDAVAIGKGALCGLALDAGDGGHERLAPSGA